MSDQLPSPCTAPVADPSMEFVLPQGTIKYEDTILTGEELQHQLMTEPRGIEVDADEATLQEKIIGTVGKANRIDLVKMALLFAQGHDVSMLARAFNTTPDYIKVIKSTKKFKDVVNALNNEIVATARTLLSGAGFKAVRTLVDCLQSPDDRVKLKAATEILDRIGLKSPEQIEILERSNVVRAMTDEELFDLVKRGNQEITLQKREDGTYGV